MAVCKLEWKSAQAPKLVKIGVRVRPDCPRFTVECPIVLDAYAYSGGKPVKGIVTKNERVGTQMMRREYPDAHISNRSGKVYTFQKLYEGAGKKRDIRFIETYDVIAEALVEHWGEWLDVRYASDRIGFDKAKEGRRSARAMDAVAEAVTIPGAPGLQGDEHRAVIKTETLEHRRKHLAMVQDENYGFVTPTAEGLIEELEDVEA